MEAAGFSILEGRLRGGFLLSTEFSTEKGGFRAQNWIQKRPVKHIIKSIKIPCKSNCSCGRIK
jgi:hypothetical protein